MLAFLHTASHSSMPHTINFPADKGWPRTWSMNFIICTSRHELGVHDREVVVNSNESPFELTLAFMRIPFFRGQLHSSTACARRTLLA